MDLEELKKELILTQEDYHNLSEEQQKAVERRNAIIEFMSNYAFDCQCCKYVASWLNPYRIIKGSLTTFELALAGFARGTHKEDIKSLEGIFPLSSLEEKPECNSTLNWINKVGYVCDHCYNTVFNDN